MPKLEIVSDEYLNIECTDGFVGIGESIMEEKGRVSFPKRGLTLNGKSLKPGDCFSVFTIESTNGVYLCPRASLANKKLPPQVQKYPDIALDNQGRISIYRSLRNILGVIPERKTTVFFTGKGDYCSISLFCTQKTKLDSSIREELFDELNNHDPEKENDSDSIENTRVKIRNATFKLVKGPRPRVKFNIVLTLQGSLTISNDTDES